MNKEFDFHLLNEKGKQEAMKIATIFDFALDKLIEVCPTGREFSICRTKLEEACFFAKKAMAGHLENHSAKNEI